MNDFTIFNAALGLTEEWGVVKVDFDLPNHRLDIYLDFKSGTKFSCPVCGTKSTVYDSKEKVWRHFNFFQYETYLHARIPRITCKNDGVKQITVPWARENSGFTLLFESLILNLAKTMSVNTVAKMFGVHDTRLWRIIKHYVTEGLNQLDLSTVKRIGIDETSRKRGHKYVSVFVDIDTSKVIFVTEGKDSTTIKRFSEFLTNHNGNIAEITEVSSDLSPAFISGVEQYLPNAKMTFDKFHIMKLLNVAVDQIRREEQKQEDDLKKSRYMWLKNPENLTQKEQVKFETFSKKKLKTGRAYRMKLTFQDLFKEKYVDNTEELLKWCSWAMHSRLEPLKSFVRTLRRHWQGVIRWFKSGITNGLLEGLNSLIQLSKARARGFRSVENFKTMIYLNLSALDIIPT